MHNNLQLGARLFMPLTLDQHIQADYTLATINYDTLTHDSENSNHRRSFRRR